MNKQIMNLLMDKKVVNYLNNLDARFFQYLSNLAFRYKQEQGLEPINSYTENIKKSFDNNEVVDVFYKGGKFIVIVKTPIEKVYGKLMASTCKAAVRSFYAEDYNRKNVNTKW